MTNRLFLCISAHVRVAVPLHLYIICALYPFTFFFVVQVFLFCNSASLSSVEEKQLVQRTAHHVEWSEWFSINQVVEAALGLKLTTRKISLIFSFVFFFVSVLILDGQVYRNAAKMGYAIFFSSIITGIQ